MVSPISDEIERFDALSIKTSLFKGRSGSGYELGANTDWVIGDVVIAFLCWVALESLS